MLPVKHLLVILVLMVNELVVFKPVLDDLYDLRHLLTLYLHDGPLEKVLNLRHVHVLRLLKPLTRKDLRVILTQSLDDLDLFI